MYLRPRADVGDTGLVGATGLAIAAAVEDEAGFGAKEMVGADRFGAVGTGCGASESGEAISGDVTTGTGGEATCEPAGATSEAGGSV